MEKNKSRNCYTEHMGLELRKNESAETNKMFLALYLAIETDKLHRNITFNYARIFDMNNFF